MMTGAASKKPLAISEMSEEYEEDSARERHRTVISKSKSKSREGSPRRPPHQTTSGSELHQNTKNHLASPCKTRPSPKTSQRFTAAPPIITNHNQHNNRRTNEIKLGFFQPSNKMGSSNRSKSPIKKKPIKNSKKSKRD